MTESPVETKFGEKTLTEKLTEATLLYLRRWYVGAGGAISSNPSNVEALRNFLRDKIVDEPRMDKFTKKSISGGEPVEVPETDAAGYPKKTDLVKINIDNKYGEFPPDFISSLAREEKFPEEGYLKKLGVKIFPIEPGSNILRPDRTDQPAIYVLKVDFEQMAKEATGVVPSTII